MRGILILALLVLLMGLAGWITFGRGSGRSTINIETDKIERETDTAVKNAQRMIDSGARAVKGDEQPVAVPPRSESEPTPQLAP